MMIASLALLLAGCPNQVPQNAPAAPVQARPSSVPAAETPAVETPAPVQPTTGGFPPLDASCEQDEDCTSFHRVLEDDGRCCYTCDHRIVAASWAEAAMAICEARSSEGCAMFKCAEPPKLKCEEGRCVAR